jgi:pyridoxal 5'-phosphate synthase pdxT subunit
MWLVTRLSTKSTKGGKTFISRVSWICQLLDDAFLYALSMTVTVGVLALQGAFQEHLQLLREAAQHLSTRWRDGNTAHEFKFMEVRNAQQLSSCDALIIPGGESTTISLVAAESNLLEPLRQFVK